MNSSRTARPGADRAPRAARGSVLVIVLWVAFGLVALALYFAQSMAFEYRAVDQRVAGVEAGLAIAGSTFYVSNLLATVETPGTFPEVNPTAWEAVQVGEAKVWFLGRGTASATDAPVFGLADEAAKLNLNTATQTMLEQLPRMTPELAAAIIDWRDTNDTVTVGGAENETYQRLRPGYRCKNGPFESIEELRLVAGMNLEILYGEDTNLNGVLDPNENDGETSPPLDNRDGRLDPGILEYLTLYSRESTTGDDGSARVSVANGNSQQVRTLLQETLGTDRAQAIARQMANATNLGSVLEFYLRSGLTADEFAQIEGQITVSTNAQEGLINVNTANEAVLGCVPGIGIDQAPALIARRQSNTTTPPSLAWVTEVLDRTNVIQAGPYLTARSYQFSVDMAAVGHKDRGYRRVRWVCDTADGTPKFLTRQDLTHLGWALGQETRNQLALARRIP